VPLAAAITQHPERHDAELILKINSLGLPRGHARYVYFALVGTVRSRLSLIPAEERERLLAWAQEMANKDTALQTRLREMQ
jgi:hypothetical protein